MNFKFYKFNNKKFSASEFLSKVNKNNNNIYDQEINLNTIRTIQLNDNAEKNEQIRKELIKKNLIKEISLNKDNSDLLKKNLSLMLSFNIYLKNKKTRDKKYDSYNKEFPNLISCFQILMKYFFEIKEKKENQNILDEKKLNELKDEKNALVKTELKNNDKIGELENKIMNLQSFLIRNHVNLEEKKYKLYICDVCPFPYKKFFSYREFHKHYVSNHVNPYLCFSQEFSIINQGFDKNYFDNKISEFGEDIYDILRKTQNKNNKKDDSKEKSNIFSGSRRNQRYETVGPSSSVYLKYSNHNLFNRDTNDKKKEIRERITNLKNNQKIFENNFKNQIDYFLEEFRNELIKLKSNQNEQK